MKYNFLLLFAAFAFINACNTVKPYYSEGFENWERHSLPDDSELVHIVYLLGDAGEKETNPIFPFIRDMIREYPDTASTVVWMGDNIYYDGLPEPDESDRKEKEEVLLRQMRVTDSLFEGRTIFIPGNHDWNESHAGGLAAVRRQEEFVEAYYQDKDFFLPSNGCAGPVVINATENLVLIVVDTEWWSHKFEKTRYPDAGCTVEDRIDLVVQLEDAIRSNQDKNILILGHHPIISNSNHGGHYNYLDHIFPLRLVRDKLYIPLPVIGSAYPLLRKLGVSPQDIPSPEGQQWKNAIFSMAENRPNVIYAAGHDHNLQLHRHQMMHTIVSGSGSKTTFAARGFGAGYVHQRKGFSRLLYYKDGQVWVEFYVADEDYPDGKLTLRSPLYSYQPPDPGKVDYNNVPDYRDSIKTIAANADFDISRFGEFILGDHYREEWTTPVTVPYIDIKSFSGGLDPIKKGGGKQTLSLRLINEDSVQFVLRSINKFPAKAIPVEFRDTWINDFVQDQISTAHPYGAFTIPKMADAIDIFYTRPKLVYTPYTPYLEQYMNQFGGMLSLIEVRPDEDLSQYARFGNSENVVSSQTMLRHLREDNDNEVDQHLYLKSRLFDMLLGDWDRHEDQWRWAEYKKSDKGSIFKPIPRDRDQVYTKYDGVVPWLLSRRWAFRNFVNFDHEIEDVKGLNMVAQNFDRMLLSSLSREDWRRIATQIRFQLSDYVIESAIRDMPTEVFQFSGEEIIAKLKSRRDKIVETAMEYYDFLAEDVYIITSDKHERFDINRYGSDSTIVRIFKTKKEGDVDRLLYERRFYKGKTKEIRIFSRGGQDRFYITGDAGSGLKIKIVGGEDEDEFNVSSKVKGFGEHITIYDNESGNIFNVNNDTKLILSEDVWVNEFDRNLYNIDYTGPRFDIAHNIDDGLLLGAGIRLERHGFKTEPMKTSHYFMAYHAFKTNSWWFDYQGQFYNLFGYEWDLRLDADYYGPDYVFNYFGYGNSTEFNEETADINYHQVKMNSFHFEPAILHRFSVAWTLGIGPAIEYYNIKEEPEKILDEFTDDLFYKTSRTSFAGVKFFSDLKLTDKSVDPEKGLSWYNEAYYHHELKEGDASFTSLKSDLSFYFTPNLPFRTTFAHRVGASTNSGDFYFYQSRFLDGNTNLRGYRGMRFAGRTNFYSNNEFRVKLFELRSNLITGDMGGIGFFDLGKVWTKQGETGEWHTSFGPGLYFNFYKLFIISSTYAISDEDRYFNFKVGFLF